MSAPTASGNNGTAGGSEVPPGHSFLSAVSEVKNMENALLSLLTSFHSGELSAFGRGHSLETMEAIRSKQERLARLHFDIGSAKGQGDNSHQGNWMSDADQNKLMAGLGELSVEIEKLHETSSR